MENKIIGSEKVIIEAIEKHQNIAIFHHIRPDGDCLGSQAGLAELIKINWPDKKVFVIGDNDGNFPFFDWHFDKIDNFNFENSLAIIVDTSDIRRIYKHEIFSDNRFTARARIDHHEVSEHDKYDYSWVDPGAAAAGELVARFAYENKLKVNKEAATKIYLSIMTDSNRYLYSAERRSTQMMGSWLLKFDVDVKYLYNNLYKRTFNDVAYQAHIIRNCEKFDHVLSYTVTDADLERFNMKANQAANFVNTLSNIDEYLVWVFFVKNEDDSYRARIRSNGPEIHLVAQQFHGGGHAFASGADLKDFTNEKQLLIEQLNAAAKLFLKKL